MITGNPGKRKIKAGEPIPIREDLPDPPPFLLDEAKVEWGRVSSELHRLGLLTKIDRSSLAAYCQAYGRWAQAEKAIRKMAERDELTGGLMIKTSNGNAIQNPLVGTANKAAGDMMRYAAEFGMTPSARVRLAVEASPDRGSKFDGLLNGAKKA